MLVAIVESMNAIIELHFVVFYIRVSKWYNIDLLDIV
jgi:hypothetical protein